MPGVMLQNSFKRPLHIKNKLLSKPKVLLRILLMFIKVIKILKYVTRQRIYLETLTEVLEGPNKIILDSTGEGQGVVPYLPLNELNKNKVNN